MILTLGIKDFDDDEFEIPYNSIEYQFLNKPAGGLWGSTFTPNDTYVSDWARFVFGERFNEPKYYHGIVYELDPLARILNIETRDDFINLLKNISCPSMLDYGSFFISDKRYIDWDAIVENYDAVHFGHDAVMSCRFMLNRKFSDGDDEFTASDLYSYDCESWVICHPVAIDFDTVREVTVNNEGELIMNKKYPSMNCISIKKTLDFYKTLDPNRDKCYGDYIHFGDGKKLLKENATVDDYIRYLTEYDNKPTRKQFDRIITSIRNLPCASSSTVELCNLLLGNRKYYDKCIMVNDGSYRANRIWFNPHCGELDVSVSLFEYDVRFSDVMTPKETVRWMFDHFDTIWLQCNCGDTVEELEMNMNQTKLNDSINQYYDDQIWSCTDDSRFE